MYVQLNTTLKHRGFTLYHGFSVLQVIVLLNWWFEGSDCQFLCWILYFFVVVSSYLAAFAPNCYLHGHCNIHSLYCCLWLGWHGVPQPLLCVITHWAFLSEMQSTCKCWLITFTSCHLCFSTHDFAQLKEIFAFSIYCYHCCLHPVYCT